MLWPSPLIAELASRRCIIFLGAGASAGCKSSVGTKNPPKWDQFLNGLVDAMPDKSDLPIINDYISKQKYLEAAEIIKKDISSAQFTEYIRKEFTTPKFAPSKIHKSVLELDPKIVITTNYDQVYDDYCKTGSAEGYNVSKYYESQLASDLKTPIRLIIKAHGCVSHPRNIVLTKSEYFKARQDYPNFYKILDALFLTHTILFIGYSLNDPDIQLVLENVNITAPDTNPHYFVCEDSMNETIKSANRKTYNLDFIEFESGNYSQLEDGIAELVQEVELHRISNPSV